jgi:hypothetical protein
MPVEIDPVSNPIPIVMKLKPPLDARELSLRVPLAKAVPLIFASANMAVLVVLST